MTTGDVLDELAELPDDVDVAPEPAAAGDRLVDVPITAPAFVRVCDRIKPDGEVCGETISSADYAESEDSEKSARAAWARHVRMEHPKDGGPSRPSRKKDKRPARERVADEPIAPELPKVPHGGAEAYASGIAMLAMVAWLTPGTPVDDFDHACIVAGAPNLGGQLDALADRHKVVRQALDLILVGGGGPYMGTMFAVLAIAGPIAEHHGLVPAGVGSRWGTLIGVAEVPPPAPRSPSSTGDAVPHTAPSDVPPHVDGATATEPAVTDHPNAPGADGVVAVFPSEPATPSAAFVPMGDDGAIAVNGGVPSHDAALAHS